VAGSYCKFGGRPGFMMNGKPWRALTGLLVVPLVAAGAALGGCAAVSQAINGVNCAVQLKGADVQVQLLHAGSCTIPVGSAGTWVQAPHAAQPGDPGAMTGKPMSVICTLVQQDSTLVILDTAGSSHGRRYCQEAAQHGWHTS
jgi:hypothetical protein